MVHGIALSVEASLQQEESCVANGERLRRGDDSLVIQDRSDDVLERTRAHRQTRTTSECVYCFREWNIRPA